MSERRAQSEREREHIATFWRERAERLERERIAADEADALEHAPSVD